MIKRNAHSLSIEEEKNMNVKYEYSDESNTLDARNEESLQKGRNLKQDIECGGFLGALFLMVSFPFWLIALYITCSKESCSFFKLPDLSKYAILSTYIDLSSVLSLFGILTFLTILSVIPFGGKKVVEMPMRQEKFVYILNGLFCFFVLSVIFIGLELNNIHVFHFILEHYFHLLIASLFCGHILGTLLYIKSLYVPHTLLNPHILGKNEIYGYYMGKEVAPRIFGILDLTVFFNKYTIIATVLVDVAFLYKTLVWNLKEGEIFSLKYLNVNTTLFLVVLFHSVYVLDGLVFEEWFLTTFEVQNEGFGWMTSVGMLVYPFMMSTVTRYVAEHNVYLATWKLIFLSFVFLLGYLLYRGSNNQKDTFKRNPCDPTVAHLETIETSKGTNLICSGFWGIVRHPNYFGDILMNLALLPFVWNVPPVTVILFNVALLIHRTRRVNSRCKQKYGAAWDKYCSKVKYALIPTIY